MHVHTCEYDVVIFTYLNANSSNMSANRVWESVRADRFEIRQRVLADILTSSVHHPHPHDVILLTY